MSDALIPLAGVNFQIFTQEHPPKQSRYIAAGAPTHCQNEACGKPFVSYCIRGANDHYYCCEVCAQVGMEINFDNIANDRKPTILRSA